jgi:hypothetical protein
MCQTKVVGKIKPYFTFIYFFSENRAAYEIMWINTVQPGRPHEKMAHAHCMLDA